MVPQGTCTVPRQSRAHFEIPLEAGTECILLDTSTQAGGSHFEILLPASCSSAAAAARTSSCEERTYTRQPAAREQSAEARIA